MVQTAFASLLPALTLAGCAYFQPAPPPDLCSFEVLDASAWTNRMPGPDGPANNLIVILRVDDDGISRRFQAYQMEGRTLPLHVAKWEPEEGLGKIVYRGKSQGADRVEIFCDGLLVTSLDVAAVY
ncbi:MAG: hypothetical protein RLN72_00705 [Henriciella sp.]